MTAIEILGHLQESGAQFEYSDDRWRLQSPVGGVPDELREELAAHKAEILALLPWVDTEVAVNEFKDLGCPHCKELLIVFTHPLDDEVWIQCPAKSEIFKSLKHATNEWCSDCGVKLSGLVGRCVECIRRVMLAPDLPCPVCGGVRFWRHRATKETPAGFAWRCAGCSEPSGKVAVYQSARKEVKRSCRQA